MPLRGGQAGGKQRKRAGGGGKATAKPKARGGGVGARSGAAAGGGQAVGRNTIPPGGRGFRCPREGCARFFETAVEAIEHGGAACGVVEPRPSKGECRCLWDGCTVTAAEAGHIRTHEARHTPGPPPRGFLCPHPGCDAAFPAAAAAHAHALAAHGVVCDVKRCLWEGCGKVSVLPRDAQWHEWSHTDAFPHRCPEPKCNKGFVREGKPPPSHNHSIERRATAPPGWRPRRTALS